MTPPALEIADLIRTAELPSSSETASGSVGNMSECCWRLYDVARLRSAGISMSAPAAHIVPRSRITAAVIAIAQVSDRCSRTVDCRT